MICPKPQGKVCDISTSTMSGLLKRKYEELEDDSTCSSSSSPSSSATSSGGESDEEYACSPMPSIKDFTPTSILKKAKRVKKNNVEFDSVLVYYFQRCQGFTSVPSRGGCTLGMKRKHCSSRHYTMEEFSKEQLNRRREKLKERLKEEKLMALKNTFTMNGTIESEKANNLTIDDICDEDIDMTDGEVEDGFCPRMYPAKKRRALLKSEGVKKIDKSEKHELNEIRRSREDCGCDCVDFCEPETCSCNLAGIKCQRDHSTFPCGCSKDGCGNRNGRVEFNSSRVQTHYIHTVMKLELEEKSQSSESNDETEDSCGELLNPFGYPPAVNINEERTVPTSPPPSYQFSMSLDAAGENSCSSDITDFSTSSCHSEDSEEPFETTPDKSQSDVDDDYLARILHFNDSEYEESSSDCQDNLSFFHSADFFCDNVYDALSRTEKPASGTFSCSLSNVSKCMDENANQGGDCSVDRTSVTTSVDSTVSGTHTEAPLKTYPDINLSSDCFELAYPDYNLGPLYNSLKEYDHSSYQPINIPGVSQSSDSHANFLESLIGSSESIPDTLVPFMDNQLLLEDAFKSSFMESLIV
ncbi:cysteine/serine-rich nuclear protein 1 [Spea bombifrons]|uniref:cysteine/serine-rich nuclear protein 1 n=1 Tax=Spea bombifrons TaxID=233779 RepID=UPI00234AE97D|nr:cysteine/serine-rich nuclear protein 1 [Spea bombifrons]